MSALPNGEYRTAAGSKVTLAGEHGGIITIDFDWFEEDNSCIDCEPGDINDGCLVWFCDRCGGGRAKLEPIKNNPNRGV